MKTIATLTADVMQTAIEQLSQTAPDLARLAALNGLPPLWQRPATFATLVHIILEQQVSLASAKAAFDRLGETLGTITPESFLRLDDAELRSIGFSRQKTRYCRLLAQAILNGNLDIDALQHLPDGEVHAELTKITGIGTWTANIYLLMVLLRPDIWPTGDRALAVAVKEVKQLERVPTYPELDQIALAWRPYRAVAARLLWHDYLKRRRG